MQGQTSDLVELREIRSSDLKVLGSNSETHACELCRMHHDNAEDGISLTVDLSKGGMSECEI